MNMQQRKYAEKRLNNIKTNKVSKAREECKLKVVKLTDKEKYSMVKSGKVKILPFELCCFSYGSTWVNYDFSKYEQKKTIDDVKLAKEVNNIEKAYNKAMDLIMLGDDFEEISKVIAEFEGV